MVRARWRRWALALAIMVVASMAVVLLAPALPSPDSGGPPPAWRETLSAVLTVVGSVVSVVGIVVAVRAGMYSGRYAAQARKFSLAQRRQARRCVRRGRQAPQELGALAVLIAEALVRQRHILILFAGIATNLLANVVSSTNLVWATIEVALVVMMVALLIIALVTARGARQWLQTYAPATSDQSVE